jgi:hypothetical protein
MATDLTLTLAEDRPGALSAVTEALGGAGTNIEGLTEVEGHVHVLVEDAAAARQALQAAGLAVHREEEVLLATPPDRPGELGKITGSLAGAGVSVRFLYLATNTRVVIGVDDLERGREALSRG